MLRLLRISFLATSLALSLAPVALSPTYAYAVETKAQLVQYSPETNLKALASKGKTVVFFFATWCPNCILTLTELSEKWSEVNPDITLVIADYDKEAGLKAEYGVTYQDTFVLLDTDAKSLKLWNAGGVAGLNKNVNGE